MSSGPHWWKPQRKRPIGKFLMNFFVLTCLERHLSAHYMTSVVSRASKWWVQVFWAPSLSSFAPLKHCPEAIQLSEELSKVLGQLPCTFSFRRTRSRLRRLRSEFQDALWPLLFKALAIRAWGLLLMLWHYITVVHVVRNRLVLILLKLVPPLISYDVICVETLHLNNVARF